jgi:hypothetical protein
MGGFAGNNAASEAQVASLNSQLAAARKEANVLQQQLAGLQAEHGQLAEHAASREGALTAEVRRVAVRAAEAARAAADDKAALLGQVRCGVIQVAQPFRPQQASVVLDLPAGAELLGVRFSTVCSLCVVHDSREGWADG